MSGRLLARRDALIGKCDRQRQALAVEARNLLAPLDRDHLRATLGARLKIPLILGGAALGLLATRPKRILPMLMTGAALWKSARGALPLVQRIASRFTR
ncbi:MULTISPECIES: YqjK family protein [unclassified Janthinobacterium]|uniref:YqjK family protein n=1 Tax=unclassified Janthinobacterium TaxID=2610881 RepID=UPI00034A3966|nr:MULTISPECIES: YqjK family protein [unclassified Janthinobacterium]MEC5160931.1 hypothetical protein [Janthinobacterium sp. CG_S6]